MGLFDSMLESHERIKKHAATTRAVWGIVSDAKEITRLVGQIKEESRITKIRVPLSSEECLGKNMNILKDNLKKLVLVILIFSQLMTWVPWKHGAL